MERYQGRVYRLALRILRDEDQARDASQDAFLKVYASLSRFEGRSSFYTWLYRLVMNLCLDLKRKDRSDRYVEWEEERLGPDSAHEPTSAGMLRASGPPGPGQELERAELRAALAAAVSELPEEARATLLLREVDGLSYAEIAEVLEIPKGTVMSRLHHARRRVREVLEANGAVPEPDAGEDPT